MSAYRPCACIGPNAVTQLLAPMRGLLGEAPTRALLREAGFAKLPDLSRMLDERPVARLHAMLRERLPEHQARHLAIEAGLGTAQYLLAHRIPILAAALLRRLPDALAMRLLLRAIGAHAWTFAGSGRFEVISTRPWTLAIADNPLARDQQADAPVCAWHAAVFEHLFRNLLGPAWRVTELGCCAIGDRACRFMAYLDPDQPTRFPLQCPVGPRHAGLSEPGPSEPGPLGPTIDEEDARRQKDQCADVPPDTRLASA